MDPLTQVGTRSTPQMERTLGRTDEVRNSAGGFVFKVSDEQRALRFLILGTTGGTFYTSERDLTKQNADFLVKMAQENGQTLVDLIVDVSVNGRAPRQNPTLFALAACAGSKNPETRRAAEAAVTKVCRTGTHLFIFAKYVQQFRGWGAGLRSAIADWYLSAPVDKVAYQAVKYRQREGWSHRDLLRLSHATPEDQARDGLFAWITGKSGKPVPRIVAGYEMAQQADLKEIPSLIEAYDLPWEALPDAALNLPETWEALLPRMGLTATIRQLGRLSRLGVVAPFSAGTKAVVDKLSDPESLRKARVHPLQILMAYTTYQSGSGWRSDAQWNVVPQVVEALSEAFYTSFGFVDPAGKRTLVGLDVSGSMAYDTIAGTNLTPRDASAALAMTWLRTEPEVYTMGFTSGYGAASGFTSLPFTKTQSLQEAIRTVSGLDFGGTDCAIPMQWAAQNNVPVDTFVVITDNETWAGRQKPVQALESYRQKTGIPSRLVVIGMTATDCTIADPNDSGMLDVVGFDTATPNLVAGFSRGDF